MVGSIKLLFVCGRNLYDPPLVVTEIHVYLLQSATNNLPENGHRQEQPKIKHTNGYKRIATYKNEG